MPRCVQDRPDPPAVGHGAAIAQPKFKSAGCGCAECMDLEVCAVPLVDARSTAPQSPDTIEAFYIDVVWLRSNCRCVIQC
eukprot:366269-Chlamydomonas_euryale.AAC.7